LRLTTTPCAAWADDYDQRPVQTVNGILLLYDRPLEPNAPTIMEHVDAFARHSSFDVWSVNTGLGFPKTLGALDFSVVLLHYSLFGIAPFKLDEYFERYLDRSKAYKVAFFQDEYQFCRERFDFLRRYDVDCVYTLLEPEWWPQVYGKHTSVPKLVHNIPGYVSEDLVALARRLTKPDDERTVDVGYRTRTLAPYVGRGGLEKVDIALRFLEHARGTDLRLDIGVDEGSRIYGDAWFEFVANCRAVLGVEAGVSIFDVEGDVRVEWERSGNVPEELEDNIYYRTVSPRHFEAAALRVCQVLYRGKYSGALEPDVHYIPLDKDFSNFDHVVAKLRDPEVRRAVTDNAYRDLVASGRFSYEGFVKSFDDELVAAGLRPGEDEALAASVTRGFERDLGRRRAAIRLRAATVGRQFRGRETVVRMIRPGLNRMKSGYRRWRFKRWSRTVTPGRDV
jgi:hypothetical protein